jgi:hypothetical protein
VLASQARLERLLVRFRRGHLPLVVKLISDGFAAGVFDPRLPPALVLVAMVMLGGPGQVILGHLGGVLPLSPPAGEPLTADLMRILLRGVQPSEPPARKRPKPRAG